MEGRTESSDSELLGAVADGDTGALRVLYDRHAPWLSVRLTRRCNDPGLVAEVVQDTFVAAWRGAASYRGTARSRAGCGGWPPGASSLPCGGGACTRTST